MNTPRRAYGKYVYRLYIILQYIKLVWKRRINRIFDTDQTNFPKQLKFKVAVKNNFFFKKKLSGADHNWSKQIKKSLKNYEVLIFSKVWGLQPATLLLV